MRTTIPINPWRHFKEICNTSSMAIIGNAHSALRFRAGRHIDSAGCVVRVNNYSVEEKYHAFVGRKTDVCLTSFRQGTYPQHTEQKIRQDGVKAIWSGIPDCRYVAHWKQDIIDGYAKYPSYAGKIFIPGMLDFLSVTCKPRHVIERRLLLNSVFGSRLLGILNLKWPVPTTGLIWLYLVIKCRPEQILIAGFDFHSSEKPHYYDQSGFKGPSHHDFSREPWVMARMIRENPEIQFTLAIDPGPFRVHEEGGRPIRHLQIAGREAGSAGV